MANGNKRYAQLRRAVQSGQKGVVKRHLNYKINLDRIFNDGEVLVNDATRSEDPDMIQMLVDAGASINLQAKLDQVSNTPLSIAIAKRSAKMIHELIYYGANINLPCARHRETPLIRAINDVEMTKVLLDRGAIFQRHIYFKQLARRATPEFIDFLHQQVKDLPSMVFRHSNWTLFNYLLHVGYEEALSICLKYPYDISHQDIHSKNYLMYCIDL